jgi:AcrR family transcriptional regulator
MGSTERREREKQALQTQILDATRAILSERGYEGLTMRAVADRVEYSAAALYKHFTDREELVRALCARDFYAFAQVLNARPGAALDADADPIDRLRGIGRSYAEFAIQHPEQYRVMFMAAMPGSDVIQHGDPEQDAYALVSGAVQVALDAGHFRGLDKDLIAQTMWSTMHGVVAIEITHLCVKKPHIPFAPLEDRVETALEGILLGLEALARERAIAKPAAKSTKVGPSNSASSAKPAKSSARRAPAPSVGRVAKGAPAPRAR